VQALIDLNTWANQGLGISARRSLQGITGDWRAVILRGQLAALQGITLGVISQQPLTPLALGQNRPSPFTRDIHAIGRPSISQGIQGLARRSDTRVQGITRVADSTQTCDRSTSQEIMQLDSQRTASLSPAHRGCREREHRYSSQRDAQHQAPHAEHFRRAVDAWQLYSCSMICQECFSSELTPHHLPTPRWPRATRGGRSRPLSLTLPPARIESISLLSLAGKRFA
jgi:hypothetical protein